MKLSNENMVLNDSTSDTLGDINWPVLLVAH